MGSDSNMSIGPTTVHLLITDLHPFPQSMQSNDLLMLAQQDHEQSKCSENFLLNYVQHNCRVTTHCLNDWTRVGAGSHHQQRSHDFLTGTGNAYSAMCSVHPFKLIPTTLHQD